MLEQLSVQWFSYRGGEGGGGSGSQVCLIEEQCGEAGGGGRLSFQTLRQEARQSP